MDLRVLGSELGASASDLFVKLHVMLVRFEQEISAGQFPTHLLNKVTRNQWENTMEERVVQALMHDNLLERKFKAYKSSQEDSAAQARLVNLLGTRGWAQLMETREVYAPTLAITEAVPPQPPLSCSRFWRVRSAVSLASFRTWFKAYGSRAKDYPLVAALLTIVGDQNEAEVSRAGCPTIVVSVSLRGHQ